MPDLLLELRSEEIPARMQRKAAGDLRKMVTDGLVKAGLIYEAAREYWTPRRLALDVRGLTARSKDVSEEIKGPSTKAPEQAVQGFLRKAGLTDISQAHMHSDPRKGDFYVARISKPGRPAEEIIAELVPSVVRTFPWPKSMRWGKASARPGSLRWVRPLQSILCTFGPETEEPAVVDFEVDGISSGNVTYGHRFHAPEAIPVRRFDDYVAKLEAAWVVLDAERRKAIIAADAKNLAFANGLELVEDEGLLEEVSGLVEWPVVLMGEFEESFLDIPAEIIRLTIRANQKCFVTRPAESVISPLAGEMGGSPEGGASQLTFQAVDDDKLESSRPTLPPSALPGISPARGEISQSRLSNRFILTANIEASDGGVDIARGNGTVVRARLSDAVHFWKTDQADLPDLDRLEGSAAKFGLDLGKPLDQRMARLDHLGVTFHARLGTQGERVERIARLAEDIAPIVGADPALARRAAVLAKADLQTEVVGEFPELQGQMGRAYALLQGEDPAVAAAIEEHYRPQGPSDSVPTDPVSIAVALADKLDTLTGFWAIDEKPTGSKDPYALRRAALGVVRILVENGVGLGLLRVVEAAYDNLIQVWAVENAVGVSDVVRETGDAILHFERKSYAERDWRSYKGIVTLLLGDAPAEREEPLDMNGRSYALLTNYVIVKFDLLSFLHDRLKVYLRDKGARHDLIDAVLAGGAHPSSGPSGHLLPQGEKEGRGGDAGSPSPLVGDGGSPRSGETGEGSSANDDLVVIVRKVEALGALLETEDGKNLLAGTKRAANILAAEEKKGTAVASQVDPALFSDDAERALFEAVNRAERQAGEAIGAQDFSAAMRALAALRQPVDAFFERVMVNEENAAVRANRLALLARIRAATGQVADFSKIAG